MVLLALGTRQIKDVRGLFRLSPFVGAALLLCSLAIAGAPPFPIFLSEFSILSAGIRSGHNTAVAILAILIVVAFVAIMRQVNSMLFGKPELHFHCGGDPCELPQCCAIGDGTSRCVGCFYSRADTFPFQLAAQQLGGH